MRPIDSGAETDQVANEPKEGTNEGVDHLEVGRSGMFSATENISYARNVTHRDDL